jgi:hypothetical protein
LACFAPSRDVWRCCATAGLIDHPALVSPRQNGRPGFQIQGKGLLGKGGIGSIIAKMIGQVKSQAKSGLFSDFGLGTLRRCPLFLENCRAHKAQRKPEVMNSFLGIISEAEIVNSGQNEVKFIPDRQKKVRIRSGV